MKHKTATLEGALLDAAVAVCEVDALPDYWRDPEDGTCWARPGREEWRPTERWEQGGPIIERERINLHFLLGGDGEPLWAAEPAAATELADYRSCYGRTPLIAAMRTYVASKLGKEVELP